jgi:hypothetical protein
MRRQKISRFEKKIKETRDDFWRRRLKLKMDSIVMLTNEIPWVMAPASLVAGVLAASLIRAVFRFKRKPIKVMAIGVMLALSAGMLMMQSMS